MRTDIGRRFSELHDNDEEGLAALSPSVSPDGDAVVFAVELESSKSLTVKIPFEQMGQIEATIRNASAMMQNRLLLRPYLANDKILDLMRIAERPDKFDLFVDPITGDWCFVYQFANAAPFALKVDPRTCLENMAAAMRMIRATMN